MKTDVTAYVTLKESLIAAQEYARKLMCEITTLKKDFAIEILFDDDLREELREKEKHLYECAIRAIQLREEMRGEL